MFKAQGTDTGHDPEPLTGEVKIGCRVLVFHLTVAVGGPAAISSSELNRTRPWVEPLQV